MHNALMIFLVGALSIPVAQTVAAAPSPQTYLPKALAGDYQAQRNLAYTYGADLRDFSKACSWYLLILRSDSPSLNIGDLSNAETYCGMLSKQDENARLKAEREANQLYRKIYQK
ncbi:hypothetical protein BLA9940_07078 [Burkholderia aenigmatica]|uniref:Sel1 repeat family protein n=1 Tax=Burkholderia aenigmatica TaxID=2015348 RepID=A0A6J5ITC8_9BURK|nr:MULTISPECIES: hypothetical protein [Burkholderia]MBJ9695915.1 hypothetical protein [Burkholderia cenocepacia]CAB3962935.1 hypothetical protein BLA3211_02005 [Burkholderia aenigmatica]VWD14822.1 hypothetical protein BLA9940_07078 [Burkholderia aenigmatica]